jgi:hypothetical protein
MDRQILKKFKTKKFSCYLTEYDNKFTIEYKDKRKVLNKFDILQVTEYENFVKAEFNFNLLVDSIILLDIEHIKKYMLYMQNDYKQNQNVSL